MFSLLLLLQFITPNFAQLDTGNGSDGACTEATFAAVTRTYNCTTLTITGASSVFSNVNPSGSIVTIKVQGAVSIGNTLSLNGGNGLNGANAATVNGGNSGAGGGSGGNGIQNSNGQNGNGPGSGSGGVKVDSAADAYGGGGGGGSYSTVGINSPVNGDDSGTTISNSAGVQGALYGNETEFENSFQGGSGGGAGGAGELVTSEEISGSSGGGGGGAIKIVAGGNITISGSIQANGGNGGGDGSAIFSGGGGGSGGAIWLQSLGNIIISGSLSATGGARGTSNGFADEGFGGSGGNGRIRLDDVDGVITGGGTVTPSAQVNSIAEVIARNNARNAQLTSDIDCAARGAFSPDDYMSFVLGLLIVFGVKSFWRSQRSEKFLKEKRHSN